MTTSNTKFAASDELLGIISALAEAQDVSECEISATDILDFCDRCGWEAPNLQLSGLLYPHRYFIGQNK